MPPETITYGAMHICRSSERIGRFNRRRGDSYRKSMKDTVRSVLTIGALENVSTFFRGSSDDFLVIVVKTIDGSLNRTLKNTIEVYFPIRGKRDFIVQFDECTYTHAQRVKYNFKRGTFHTTLFDEAAQLVVSRLLTLSNVQSERVLKCAENGRLMSTVSLLDVFGIGLVNDG